MKIRLRALAILLAALCGCGILTADIVTGIAYTGVVHSPSDYKIATMTGDSIAMFNYQINSYTITLTSFTVSPTGVVSPLQTLLSYDSNPEWGELSTNALFFEYKNDMLMAAFQAPGKIIVTFSDNDGTELHLFDIVDSNVFFSGFHLVSDSLGYAAVRNPSNVRIFRLDFATDSLILLYQYASSFEGYSIYSLADDYLLFACEYSSTQPDYLYQGANLIHNYPDHWIQRYYPTIYNVKRICGQYYYIEIPDGLEDYASWCTLAYIENDQLQFIEIPHDNYGEGTNFWLDCCVTQSDSTFSCIYYSGDITGPAMEYEFRNYTITNNTLVPDASFPDLSSFVPPRNLFKMSEDYMVAVTGAVGEPRTFILADYINNRVREYTFNVETNSYVSYYNSSEYIYMLSPANVHLFHLYEYVSVDDEVVPAIKPQIRVSPNPFAGSCEISVSGRAPQTIGIYDLKGQLVRSLAKSAADSFVWDGRDDQGIAVACGIYLVKLNDKGKSYSQKLVLIK